jgi:DNA-binding transcriptional ArsR family regulator
MKTITLVTNEQLKIFMQPTRQKILHLLSVKGPMTPKMIADDLVITSSSAKHHLLKLLELEIVEQDHQELIHGITATYYRKTLALVSLGGIQGEEKEVLVQNLLREVQEGFFKKAKGFSSQKEHFTGDVRTGVLHLSLEEADKLNELIGSYIGGHEEKKEGTFPFVYSLVVYHG